jgi:hypothetical protein
MARGKALLIAGACAALLWGCGNIPFLSGGKSGSGKKTVTPPRGEKVVAIVGGNYITASDLNKEVETFNSMIEEQAKRTQTKAELIDTQEEKVAYLKEMMVPRYMYYEEALALGLDKDPDLKKTIDMFKINVLGDQVLQQEIKRAEVTDRDVEEFLSQNKDHPFLNSPEARRVYEIVVGSEAQAKMVLSELYRDADFSDLARQYSTSASKDKGGDLGMIPLPRSEDEVTLDRSYYEQAFSLERGKFTPYFKDSRGKFVILKVTDIKPGAPLPRSEIEQQVREGLAGKKQMEAKKALEDSIKNRIEVKYFEEKVE